MLMGLGTLAVLELVGTKFTEAEELLGEVHKYSKTGMSFLTTMGILSAKDTGFIEGVFDQGRVGCPQPTVAFPFKSDPFLTSPARRSRDRARAPYLMFPVA
jgi:hypothetical protein